MILLLNATPRKQQTARRMDKTVITMKCANVEFLRRGEKSGSSAEKKKMHRIEVGIIKQSINQPNILKHVTNAKPFQLKIGLPRIKISALSPLKWLFVYGRSPRGGGGGGFLHMKGVGMLVV